MSLKPIVPNKPIVNVAKLTRPFSDAINEELQEVQKDFERTTRTWKTRVRFRIVKARKVGTALQGAAGTDNEIYGYVTRGTRPHIINARNGRMLSFSSGYSAKTRRGLIGSGAGGSFGARAFAKSVRHPGTQARDFEPTIAKLHQKSFERRVNDKLSKAQKSP